MRNHFLRASTPPLVTSGLKVHYDANSYSGSGDWQDESGNNDHASITNATYVDSGNSDYFRLDGSSISIPTTDPGNTFANFFRRLDKSINVWFKAHKFSGDGGGTSARIFAAGYRAFKIHAYAGSDGSGPNRVFLSYYHSGSWHTAGYKQDLSINTWYNYTLTWDQDGDITGYFDGSTEGVSYQDSSPGDISYWGGASATDPNIIGNTGSESGTRDFDGDIAIFSIYDRVLTGSEVTQNYNHFKNRYT